MFKALLLISFDNSSDIRSSAKAGYLHESCDAGNGDKLTHKLTIQQHSEALKKRLHRDYGCGSTF